jgi:phage baseplate assembly protein W
MDTHPDWNRLSLLFTAEMEKANGDRRGAHLPPLVFDELFPECSPDVQAAVVRALKRWV